MKPDPDHEEYMRHWSSLYEASNYDQGLAGYFLGKSHEWSERAFGKDCYFPKVLEVGAGTGMHLRYLRHRFDEYWLTDRNLSMLHRVEASQAMATRGRVIVRTEDAAALSFPDASFDRLIAAHVLEHMYRPHEVLREWARVLKPGGIMTLLLPCDPGMAWRLGRNLSARKKFKRAGIQYDYWMAREHVNPVNALISFIRYYFDHVEETWRPFALPSMDLNLFYIAHIRT